MTKTITIKERWTDAETFKVRHRTRKVLIDCDVKHEITSIEWKNNLINKIVVEAVK